MKTVHGTQDEDPKKAMRITTTKSKDNDKDKGKGNDNDKDSTKTPTRLSTRLRRGYETT